MLNTSEWVSVGHPDKVCDYISSYVLDRYLELDPKTRYAVEVQMKDNYVSLAGEVTTTAKVTEEMRNAWVREAVVAVGYNAAYCKRWGSDNAPNGEALEIVWHLSQQSPDIAKGVNADGWGDQGIFWGMAVNDASTNYMPKDYFYAKRIGQELYKMAKDNGVIGLDIKTQVAMDDNQVVGVVIAAPCRNRDLSDFELDANCLVRKIVGRRVRNLIINGTGAYVRHGSIGDCGTTGRKLAVDFYGGNCRIGGGSPWTKDGTKADVALNIYARAKAMEEMCKYGQTACYCALSCCIGRSEIDVSVRDNNGQEIVRYGENKPASQLIEKLGLTKPCFAFKCLNGLFWC